MKRTGEEPSQKPLKFTLRMNANPIAIRCRGLTKVYPGKPPVEAVRGIDLEVASGECFGVLGPNGAGKTTTIEILEGILDASCGEIEILGHRWGEESRAIREQIGISLQETQLSEKLTVLETLTLFRSFYRTGISPKQAISRVSLEEKSNTWVKKLSGGQKQRLAVACAIVGNPKLLFLDEPTTGLDPTSRRQMWGIIQQFRNEGRTVLLTTHYMEEAERLCDRVAIFNQGKIVAQGTPIELIRDLGGDHVLQVTIDRAAATVEQVKMKLAGLPGVAHVSYREPQFSLSVSDPHDILPALSSLLNTHHWRLSGLVTRQATLEDVFVAKVGHSLDETAA